jgi:hypothetical protein
MANFSESDIREAFQTFDRDGNGFIGASDIHNTYLAMNENLNDDEVMLHCLSPLSFSLCSVLLHLPGGRANPNGGQRWRRPGQLRGVPQNGPGF